MKIRKWLLRLLGSPTLVKMAYDQGFERGCGFTADNSAKVLHMVLERLGVCEGCAMTAIAEVTREVNETTELERISALVGKQ